MCRSPFRVIKNGLLSVLFIGGLTRGLDESVGSLRAARRPIERPSERSEAGDVQRLFHDFAFTSSLRDSMRAVRDPTHQIDRKLNIDTCMAEGADCSGSQTALCCQGGCSWSETCFCQPNDGLCFNFGEEDRFCCSNRCGHDGRCQCIAEGESCAAGDYCCGGLNCVGGTCSGDTSAPSPEPTLNPSASPITSPPVISVSSNVNELMNDKCQSSGGVCFNRGQTDTLCCSKACGADGRCEAPPPTAPPTSAEPSQSPVGQPSSSPTPRPTHKRLPSFQAKSLDNGQCDEGEVEITIEVKTDQFGDDMAWSLVDAGNGQIYNVDQGTYGLFTTDEVRICTTPGMYNFTVTDKYGDGICCAYGVGYVRVSLSGREVLYVESYGKGLNEVLNVGFDPVPLMTERDHLYLDAHNVRRMLWHTSNDLDHVPLVWSPTLAEESRIWAEKLLVNCSSSGIQHEKNVAEGENLAKNTGTLKADGSGWGQLYPPDNILRRWVEMEVKRDYPGNAHLTAALWRASKYMGCGESEKVFRGGMCRIQVCRYARAGNCDMGRYNATVGKNWLEPMLSHTSRCGPNCAPEGCY